MKGFSDMVFLQEVNVLLTMYYSLVFYKMKRKAGTVQLAMFILKDVSIEDDCIGMSIDQSSNVLDTKKMIMQ